MKQNGAYGDAGTIVWIINAKGPVHTGNTM